MPLAGIHPLNSTTDPDPNDCLGMSWHVSLGAAGGNRTPDPRFRRHIPQSTTRGFIEEYSPNHSKNVHPSSWVFNTISTSISTPRNRPTTHGISNVDSSHQLNLA